MQLDRVRAEIESLHEFFIAWFSGSCPQNDDVFAERFTRRFADGFHLIPPGGQMLGLSRLRRGIHADYGVNSDFRIAIRNVRVHRAGDRSVLATYEEWQRNAVNSRPADNGRVATVLMVTSDARPSGLQWMHVHETWLPPEVMARGPFDF